MLTLLMRFKIPKYALLSLFVLLCATSWAQSSSPEKPLRKMPKQQGPKVSTEFGLGVAARYNMFEVVPLSTDFSPEISMRMSYGAALQFRLNLGRSFGIQPEISYARSTLRINDKMNNFSTKAKSNIVQIPMLISFRAAMFRFNFGPVFTLMDEATYNLVRVEDESIQQMHLGRLFPTVTYAAGISVKFANIMTLDLRYADQFVDSKWENQYIWTLDETKQPKAQSFRTRNRSVQLRYGVVF